MSEDPQIHIEYVPLAAVQPAARNPKKHSLPDLIASIKRFGFVQPVAMNEETGKLVAGHGRLEALLAMKEAGEPVPARVVEKNGEWYVPVLRGVSLKDEQEAEAFLVADNRLVELGVFDPTELLAILQDAQKSAGALDGIGFSSVDVDDLIQRSVGLAILAGEVDPEQEWQGMTDFKQDNITGVRLIVVHFQTQAAVSEFASKLGIFISDKARFMWYPPIEATPTLQCESK